MYGAWYLVTSHTPPDFKIDICNILIFSLFIVFSCWTLNKFFDNFIIWSIQKQWVVRMSQISAYLQFNIVAKITCVQNGWTFCLHLFANWLHACASRYSRFIFSFLLRDLRIMSVWIHSALYACITCCNFSVDQSTLQARWLFTPDSNFCENSKWW